MSFHLEEWPLTEWDIETLEPGQDGPCDECGTYLDPDDRALMGDGGELFCPDTDCAETYARRSDEIARLY